MCKKCVPSIRRAKLPFGEINFFAHYVDEHIYADIPLFVNRDDNLAIEGRLYQIRQAKTKRRYNRKDGKNES